ncbi:hypothetical protein BCR36DRAFT_338933 [Piromyces finnis]|uniref:F-box domain-containing protein n=1 Tax=Piromyces finnis TaxID=1754191 RepID=A0A1Y1UVS9_9FUNG|nr:hypothetical protein BCR36DRAFT_338933 [Piromyces finnis]|eukprot:ORX41714.1 hypothetical protein BCR36DRAFT_338933 [Piromyces finnis]
MAKTLPYDIIHKIIIQAYNKQLWPIDFYNLCLVSHTFYDIAAPLLWSNPKLNSIYDLYQFLSSFYIIFSSNNKNQNIKQDILKVKTLDLGFISSYNEEFQNQYKSFSNNYSRVTNPYVDNQFNEPDNYYYNSNTTNKRIPYASELPSKFRNSFPQNYNSNNFINSCRFSLHKNNLNLNFPFLLKFLFENVGRNLQSLTVIGNPTKNILQITNEIATKNHYAFSNLNSLILLNINSTLVNKLKTILFNCNNLQHLSLRINSPSFTNVLTETKELESALKAIPHPELITFLRVDSSFPQDSLINNIIPIFKNLETLQLNGDITNQTFINLFYLQGNEIKEIDDLTIYCKDLNENNIPFDDQVNSPADNESNENTMPKEIKYIKEKEFNLKSICYRQCSPYQLNFLFKHCFKNLCTLNVYIDSFYKLNILTHNINHLDRIKELYLSYEFSENGNLQLVYYMYHESLEVLSIDSSYIRNLEWPVKRQRKDYRNLIFDYEEYKKYEEKYNHQTINLPMLSSIEDIETKLDFIVPLKKSKLKTLQFSRCSFDALNTTEIFEVCENLEELSFFKVNFLFVIPFDDLVTYFPRNVKKLTIINCGHYTSLMLQYYLTLNQLEAIHIDISDVSTDLLIALTKLDYLYSIEISESSFQISNLHKYSLCFETMLKIFAEKAKQIIENRKIMPIHPEGKRLPNIFKQIKIDFPIYMDYSLSAVRALLDIHEVQCIDIKIEGLSFQPWKSLTKFQSPTCLYQPVRKTQLHFINHRSFYTKNTVWVKKILS